MITKPHSEQSTSPKYKLYHWTMSPRSDN